MIGPWSIFVSVRTLVRLKPAVTLGSGRVSDGSVVRFWKAIFKPFHGGLRTSKVWYKRDCCDRTQKLFGWPQKFPKAKKHLNISHRIFGQPLSFSFLYVNSKFSFATEFDAADDGPLFCGLHNHVLELSLYIIMGVRCENIIYWTTGLFNGPIHDV